MKIIWLILKAISMLFIVSLCYTEITDTAWAKGVTDDSTPFILTLIGSAVALYWAYSVICVPIAPEKVDK